MIRSLENIVCREGNEQSALFIALSALRRRAIPERSRYRMHIFHFPVPAPKPYGLVAGRYGNFGGFRGETRNPIKAEC